jgi:predicted dithiol-disulfide oxidoreductase (DUF899 family)
MCQKRPIIETKETYYRAKRDLVYKEKRPVSLVRVSQLIQKRPIIELKETYYKRKRDLCAKETYYRAKRDLLKKEKRPVCTVSLVRVSQLIQKRPIIEPKET